MAAALEMNFSARMSMKELDNLAKATIEPLLAEFEKPHPAADAPEAKRLRDHLREVERMAEIPMKSHRSHRSSCASDVLP